MQGGGYDGLFCHWDLSSKVDKHKELERLQFTECYVALDSESEQLSAFISKINFNP